MKQIYNYIGAGLIALSFTNFISCTEIENGVNDIDTWEDVKDYTEALKHPCMLHTQEDFDFVKEKLQAGQQPWANAYAHLEQSEYARNTWVADPVEKLARLDQGNWAGPERWEENGLSEYYTPDAWTNYTHLMKDAAAAYQLALRWKLIAIQIYQLANAAEILRDYEGWSEADFTAYKNWMVDVFYPQATNFLNLHNGFTDCPLHYWLNWDLAEMTAVLSIGILTDDNFKINEAIQYFKFGVGGGNIINAVPFMHQDPDSGEMLGQCMESGRDQGHATLCVSLMGVFCQMAKNVGEDLFIFDEGRALAMCEYVAKYNYGEVETGSNNSGWNMENFKYDVTSVPYTNYTNCTGQSWPSMSYEEHQAGNETRGTVRPAWELVRRLASDYGQTSIYSDMWVKKMRENPDRGNSDGGAGDYGPNSGGFDQLGFGTLMFAKD